jgi:hypothetical protein
VGLVFGALITTHASRLDEVTLVMVPREDSVVRVGMDLANRYPTLLISYQVSGRTVSLHGWTGTEWVNVTPEAYDEGAFFHNGPTDAVLVEKEGEPIPERLVPPETWCSSVHKISTIDTRPLLHLIGQHYNFRYSDWKWFASNYKFSVEDINPEGLNVAWYNKPLSEHMSKQDAVVGTSDLEFWSVVRHPLDDTAAIVVLTDDEMPVSEDVAEASDDQSEDLAGEDPLTNSIPSAVVLGAGDADAELTDEPQSDTGDTESAVQPGADDDTAKEVLNEAAQE